MARLVWRILRYGLAAAGPVGTAAAQFVLSVQLLHTLDAKAFGAFSFLLVASQFATGLWSALFCAPMPILLSRDSGQDGPMRRCLMATNLVLSVVILVVFTALGLVLGSAIWATLLFASYAMLMQLRWFARAYAYAVGWPWLTLASDIVYSSSLLAGFGVIWFSHSASVLLPYASLLAGALLGLLPFGARYLKQQFFEVRARDLPLYAEVWRVHSGWSLTGVMTTEATANAHAYLVTLISGAAAFATLAASALLMRPIAVTTNALTEFERPQIARQLAEGLHRDALVTTRFFRVMLIGAWLATVIAAVLLMRYMPAVLFPKDYEQTSLVHGAVLWLTIAGVRTLRTPDSVLLQAAGQFRPLAHASVVSCGVSIVSVACLLLLAGPLYSLAGVLLGEVALAICIWRERLRWQAVFMGNLSQASVRP